MNSKSQVGYIIIGWLAPIFAFPFHFIAFLNASLSAGVPRINASSFFILAAGPVISGIAIVAALYRGKITVWKISLLIPGLLSLVEFGSALLLFRGG